MLLGEVEIDLIVAWVVTRDLLEGSENLRVGL